LIGGGGGGDNAQQQQQQQLSDAAMVVGDDCDLVQDITADCSVVASLCAAMRHMRPEQGRGSLLGSLMHPFDGEKGRPAVSGNGKYVFRMHFNGCFRRVEIDDRLPTTSTGRTLFVVDRRNPQLVWPALVEKAYLKIRGGYDFPGSNSGTDLWVLTGWIPEQIFLQDDEVDLDQSWSRIRNAFAYGDVVVTLGTGRLSADEEEVLGLAGEHDYAVMDLKTDDEGHVRQMLLKNPWCDGLVWRGGGGGGGHGGTSGAAWSLQSVASSLPSAVGGGGGGGTASDESSNKLKDLTGLFWISFDDVRQHFESLYLNWNPALFTHRQDHHFSWTLPSQAMALSLAHNPQYSLRATSDGSVWILLSRHFQDDELALARSRTSSPTGHRHHDHEEEDDDKSSSSLGYMSLLVFEADGKRVQLSDRPRSIHRGPFVDSSQTLLRFEAARAASYTVAVAQSQLPLPSYAFTLSFFSRGVLAVTPAAEALAHQHEVEGAWTRRTAGGNAGVASFLHNPQYALELARPTALSLLLCADRDDVAVRVDLVSHTGGGRVVTLRARDIAVSSGEYRRGTALAEVSPARPAAGLVEVPAGTYTIVVSTFEPCQLAGFALRVATAHPLASPLQPVPSDAAGMRRTQLHPVALARPDPPASRFRLPVRVDRLSRTLLVARTGPLSSSPAAEPSEYNPHAGSSFSSSSSSSAAATAAVRVTLELGSGPRRVVLASTSEDGEFRDAALGLRTPTIRIHPDSDLWVALEIDLVGPMVPGQFVKVDVLSEHPVRALAPWEAVED